MVPTEASTAVTTQLVGEGCFTKSQKNETNQGEQKVKMVQYGIARKVTYRYLGVLAFSSFTILILIKS